MLDYTKSFIEEQFPVSKVSKESYKERRGTHSQTLTRIGKWWGRKPLVLVKATVLGCLLPVSDNSILDKKVFMHLMGMDKDMLFNRLQATIPVDEVYKYADKSDQRDYFVCLDDKAKYDKGFSLSEKKELQKKTFERMPYKDKIYYCARIETMDMDSLIDWDLVNGHLQTSAKTTKQLIEQLSIKKFGHTAKIGDCFSGGGSLPFEAARLGTSIYASDLNPVAMLLTWANQYIVGCDDYTRESLVEFQNKLFDNISNVLDELEVEEDKSTDSVAKFYLYCNEVVCPECGYKVPTFTTMIIGARNKVAVVLHDNAENKNFDIELKILSSSKELKDEEKNITVKDNSIFCPHCRNKTSITSIRNANGNLRMWESNDFYPREDDIFQERLYAVRYVKLDNVNRKEELRKKDARAVDSTYGEIYYALPSDDDMKREKKVHNYLMEHFDEWQKKGYIPSSAIEPGYNTEQPARERGWMYWHQLFNERQLLFMGLLNKSIDEIAQSKEETVMGLLIVNRMANWNSKLSVWDKNSETGQQTFLNQALNTLFNYCCKSSYAVYNLCKFQFDNYHIENKGQLILKNAADVDYDCDIWITDPPYADAVNYHELSEFFISWNKTLLKKAFPDWYTDSKRALAIKGTGKEFNESMVEVYKNLANHMPDNGMQVVMFTHQDTKVWAELSMILWSAGLRVSTAWCIATETEAVGLKQGNYVQGTVLMVLRKQKSDKVVFKDELYEEIRDEVKTQIDYMKNLDSDEDPDFTDGDYLLAAYVAALKVLTSYKNIAGIDVQYELQKARDSSEESPVTQLINVAKKEAYDYLVPTDISSSLWRELMPEERFYIKGFELQLKGVRQLSAYQELARGFGIREYQAMFASTKANSIRLKTPLEYKSSNLNDDDFGTSILRNIFMAIFVSARDDNPLVGREFLKATYEEDNKYWEYRVKIIDILTYLIKASGKENMSEWEKDAECALMLREALRNDSI